MEEKTLKSDLAFQGGFLKVWRDQVELSDGTVTWREFIKHPGASVILAIREDKKILFVRQYRYPLKKVFLELPAGKKDANEDAITTARRELIEETGYEAQYFEKLSDLNPCIGYSDEVIHLVLAKELKMVGLKPDHGEILEQDALTIDEAMEKIKSGEITDSKTLFGIFWYYNFLKK